MAKSATKSKAAKPKADAGPKMPAPKVRKRQQVKKDSHGNTIIVLVEDVAHVAPALLRTWPCSRSPPP